MKFAEFNASTGEFLSRRDQPAADDLLKGIGSDVPAKQTEGDQAEDAKCQEEFPRNSLAPGRNRLGRWLAGLFGRFLGQRFRSPALGSGARIRLPARRFASPPESSSFIFF